MSTTPFAADVTRGDFDREVLERSREVPVVADFWASWCAPCRTLMPILAKLAAEYGGRFFLAKIDTDAQPELATRFGVRSLPTVKIFRDGAVIDEFMGALPESAIRALLERHLPRLSDVRVQEALRLREAGEAAAAADRLRAVLAADPGSDRARLELARTLLAGAPQPDALEESAKLLGGLSLEAHRRPEATALRARLELARYAADALPQAAAKPQDDGGNGTAGRFQRGVQRVLAGDYEAGMGDLLEVVRTDRRFGDDAGRKALLASFDLLGQQDERVKRFRASLARALY